MRKYFLRISVVSLLYVITMTPLHSQDIFKMAKEGDIAGVKNQISKNTDLLTTTDETGYTLLHWSLIRGKWELAGYLIDAGSDLNIQGSEGGTPLHCAANHDNYEIVKRLIKLGAKPGIPNQWGNSPLALASQRGCVNTALVLVEAGSDINHQSAEGWTPLHYACKSGHPDMQKLLLEAGASDTITDIYGLKPSDYVFTRPTEVIMDPGYFHQYEGTYYIAPGSFFRVYLLDGRLFLEDFALDEIYPIAYDQFYDYREPWKIRFFRDQEGEVDLIAVDFQRQTVVGKLVNSEDEIPFRPRLGVATRPLRPEDVNTEVLKSLFFDLKANANALIVTQVGEDTPASRAGIQVNDIILEFGNQALLNSGDLVRMLYSVDAGHDVVIKILRDNRAMYLNLTF